MPSWVNQHSFLLAGAAAMVLLAAVLLRDGYRPGDGLALGALTLGLALAYFLLRPGGASLAEAARQEIGRGTPVLIEFQSPF